MGTVHVWVVPRAYQAAIDGKLGSTSAVCVHSMAVPNVQVQVVVVHYSG